MQINKTEQQLALTRWHRKFAAKRRLRERFQFAMALLLWPLGRTSKAVEVKLNKWLNEFSKSRVKDRERSLWVKWMLPNSGGNQEKLKRDREILMTFPSDDSAQLCSVWEQLRRENELREMSLKLGLGVPDDLSRHLFGLDEDGYIHGVPWAIIKFLNPGDKVPLPEFLRIKAAIIEAKPTTRTGVLEIATQYVLSYFQEVNARKPIPEALTVRQKQIMAEARVELDREFELDSPEFVTRIPGQPPVLHWDEYWKEMRSRPTSP